MAINLGSNFAKINNNLDNQTTTSGLVLNLQKNDILDLTKKNPGLKKVILGAGWDVANNGADFDLDILIYILLLIFYFLNHILIIIHYLFFN